MKTLDHPAFGQVEIDHGPDGYWETRLLHGGREIALDLNGDGLAIHHDTLDRLAPFATELSRFDREALAAMHAHFAADPKAEPVGFYLDHHLAQVDPAELAAHLGDDDAEPRIDAARLLGALQLRRVGLYPHAPEQCAVFDYTIGEQLTDTLLVVGFNARGELVGISMES
ncbi:DUF2004 domain-containing protein [Montanilutibacter psychrotolerans]|uniref:DUF2004 domain-containing protein n=1 Tax=Montanilutibacter psychrotolerans TaxID=1327343 RepID=A0A3M8SNF6_9GAMM|nr:DUF2004 domain-containing protein [Lysobacter psychrotolerans]RNF82861.1 DUF2004 domain-containing protein [Lysobacter psychrotolerans]